MARFQLQEVQLDIEDEEREARFAQAREEQEREREEWERKQEEWENERAALSEAVLSPDPVGLFLVVSSMHLSPPSRFPPIHRTNLRVAQGVNVCVHSACRRPYWQI